MILELKQILDHNAAVTVMLSKVGDDKYSATLLVKGDANLPPVQVVASIEDIDDEVSKAYNEVSETYADAADSIKGFNKSVDDAKAKPKAKTTAQPAKKATKKAAKKTAAKKAAPKPTTPPPTPTKEPKDVDAMTQQALKDLGL